MFIKVCSSNELHNDHCVAVRVDEEEYFVVRKDDALHGYLNRCPHLGTSLNFLPNQFLTSDKSLIQCAMHGALFTIDSGDCISGPCSGQKLEQSTIKIESGAIWLKVQND